MALKENLIAHWSLEEASGSRADDIGGNTLLDTNTVTSNPGKIGTAAQLTAASGEYLALADNAALSMGDIDFTVGAWVYLDTTASIMYVLSKLTAGTVAGIEYRLFYSTGASLTFSVSNGTTNTNVAAGGVLVASSWYFAVGWHDSVANTVNIQLNNGTPVSAGHTVGAQDGVAPFHIGAANASNFWNGRLDQVGVWKRVLTTQERTDLYNGGAGLAFSQMSGTYTLSGTGTPAAATGSGAGLQYTSSSVLSGSALPDDATGTGTGLTFLPLRTLSGTATPQPATGSGIGLLFSERPGNIVALTLASRSRAFSLGDRS